MTIFSGYRVECRWPSGEEEYNLSPSETELKVSDLNPSTTYRFRIQATNERGSSPFTGKTQPEPKVRGKSVRFFLILEFFLSLVQNLSENC